MLNKIYRLLTAILHLLSGSQQKIDRSAFWTMIGTILSLILIVLGYNQLVGLKQTTDATFIETMNQRFFTNDERDLTMLLENKLLLFKVDTSKENRIFPDSFVYFKVKRDYKAINRLLSDTTRKLYSSGEIDNYFLSPLDEIALYEKKGLISMKEVYFEFGYQLNVIHDSETMKSYFKWLNETSADSPTGRYDDLQALIKKNHEYEQKLVR